MSEIPRDVKNGSKYNPAMMITDQAEADAYFEKCVQHCMAWGHTREEAEYIERTNIGYWAGYWDDETAARVHKLYKTSHSVFGDRRPRPADAFAVGEEQGKNMGVRVGRMRMEAETKPTRKAVRLTIALKRPQLIEELFELREDKMLYCRFCKKQIVIHCVMRDGELVSTTMFCDCPQSAERLKFGVIETSEVVEEKQ